jgi:hypothetical protein
MIVNDDLNNILHLDHAPNELEGMMRVKPGVDMKRLVGTPHLFGRFKHIREGFLVEPISTLTLQPDGRVTGHGHPNEGSWIRYQHSTVSENNAFAFVTAHNNWIPSSTWVQSMHDIPLGYFCDEPELIHSAQKLCLIPQRPFSTQPVIVYLIATCLAFYKRTVPLLLTELFAEGIQPE